jgi:N-acetyltransferase
MWDLQPTLVGEIVRLEPIDDEHREALFTAARPVEIWDYWPFNPGVDRAAFDRWFDGCLDCAQRGESFHFATISQASGLPVGSTSYCTIRPEHRGLEIGWTWLTPAVWGTSANTEAKFLQLQYAFETLDCIRVEFDTDEHNSRSRAALAALPAQFEGIWRNLTIRESDGSKRSSAYFSIIDDEWPRVGENLRRRIAAV